MKLQDLSGQLCVLLSHFKQTEGPLKFYLMLVNVRERSTERISVLVVDAIDEEPSLVQKVICLYCYDQVVVSYPDGNLLDLR